MEKKETVVCVVGPTASGKTDIGVGLAHAFCGEIISADSMQIYQEMPIGTAVPTMQEREGIPHHLMEAFSPDTDFSVSQYRDLARQKIEEILKKGKMPIVVGGTGLYINALTYQLDFTKTPANPECRKRLENEYQKEGAEAFHQRLAALDPDAAKRIHPNDQKRLIRRMEILESGECPAYDFQMPDDRYHYIILGIKKPREQLYRDINRRVDQMKETGLENEVRQLEKKYGRSIMAMQAIGFKEFLPYFDGMQSLDEVYEIMKRNTRRFAKRQVTWFRRDPRIKWFEKTDAISKEEMLETIQKEIKNEMRKNENE